MTDPGYTLVEIVDAVRRAGNPQKAALEALADTDGLTDAVLLDALGVEQWGDLPTVPYPDAPGKAPDAALPIQADKPAKPRKKPGPRPGRRRKAAPAPEAATRPEPQEANAADALADRLAEIDSMRAEMGATLDWLERFTISWGGILTDASLLHDEQVEALASVAETARAWLAGWDALRGVLTPAPKDTRPISDTKEDYLCNTP